MEGTTLEQSWVCNWGSSFQNRVKRTVNLLLGSSTKLHIHYVASFGIQYYTL